MSGRMLSLDEAARQIGISPDELNDLRLDQKIHAVRDGSNWKFKSEDVDRYVAALRPADVGDSGGLQDSASEEIVLLSEAELGETPPGSSTIIGQSPGPAGASDSDLRLAEPERPGPSSSDVPLAPLDDDALVLESGSDVTIDLEDVKPGGSSKLLAGVDSGLKLGEPAGGDYSLAGDSQVPLGAEPGEDLVLGGSGAGSDVTVSPGDSGISLADPADSGLSLEEPLEIKVAAEEATFELSDDSSSDQQLSSGSANLADSAEFDSDAVMDIKSDDEFLLTPLEEPSDVESQDSGSQVIALDSDSGFLDDSSATILGQEPAGGLQSDGAGFLSSGPGGMPGGAMTPAPAPAAPQAKYSAWVVLSLALCLLIMSLTGMMMFDLVRNMWSWNGAYSANSSIMDAILGLFG